MQYNYEEPNHHGIVEYEDGLLVINCRGSKRPFNINDGMGWNKVSTKNYKGFEIISNTHIKTLSRVNEKDN